MTDRADVPGNLTLRGDKITEYLLNPEHPRGGSKARFFLSFGFVADREAEFADALLGHPVDGDVAIKFRQDGSRTKLVCEGPLRCPDGRRPMVRTVWLIVGDDEATFVTAVPVKHIKPRSA